MADREEAERFVGRFLSAREEAERFKGLEPETITLSPEAYAKFIDRLNNPKPPTQALIDLMKGPRS